MLRIRIILSLLLLTVLTADPTVARRKKDRAAPAPAAPALPDLATKTRGLERHEGLLTFYADRKQGKIWLEIPPPQGAGGQALELLYVEGLATGLGSNPVALDRGQQGTAKLLRVRRLGPRVLFEQPNLRYRALSDNASEQRAAAESFATSVLWAQDVAALDPDGRALVDFTSFVVRDAHAVVARLRDSHQGAFVLDPGRSVLDLDACFAFPDNIELEAVLTFAGTEPGPEVKATAPTPTAVTLVQHHSLIRLPDEGYRPRRFDPRAGVYGLEFHDYAAGLEEPLVRRYIARHRLHKGEPLVYYVDSGIPEPVLAAVVEGASWWAEAFADAGFADAFRVEILPPEVHPLDARYNVIEWVHRATRGWSFGGGVIDPRSGEILKGHVNLGSLRIRQDRLLFEGLAGTDKTGTGAPDDPVELALARIRQLAAHEVGHTLGLGHNFAASTYGRASVMDYPAPLVTVGDAGELDFSRAYASGLGAWDLHAIRYAYSELAAGVDEAAALEDIVRQGIAAGLIFLSDDDARPPGASEPRANLWDNGSDPVAALEQTLRVRRIALAGFSERQVRPGIALSELQEVLAPIYFHHRYQLAAAVKVIGGLRYNYALRGDGQWATRPVAPEEQQRALRVILGLLTPAALDLPESVLTLLAPRPYEYPPSRESFVARTTAPAFDALGAARTAADQVLTALLQPERLGRLVDFHRRDGAQPAIEDLLLGIIDQVFTADSAELSRHAVLRRLVQRAVVDSLLRLASRGDLRPDLRAHLEWALRQARSRLPDVPPAEMAAEDAALAADVGRFFERGQETAAATTGAPAGPPPGSPIGLAGCSLGGG